MVYPAGHWTRCSTLVRTVNLHNLYNSPLKQIYTKYELFDKKTGDLSQFLWSSDS